MAWISIAKAILFVSSLIYLIIDHVNSRHDTVLENLWTSRIILASLLAFSISLLWTDADQKTALVALVKHGKLLEIVLLVRLIRSASEARIGFTAFALGQGFLLLSSWLLVADVPIAWATASGRGSDYVVFSNYLGQSVIFATMAAVFWHLRSIHLWPPWLGAAFAGTALINVLFWLEGRTGYAVALMMTGLSVMWMVPRHLRFAMLIATPIVLSFALYFASALVHDRMSGLIQESRIYMDQAELVSVPAGRENSSGIRLNAWHQSVQAISDKPWLGHGVGSWSVKIQQLDKTIVGRTESKVLVNNPHQEYLLWGVELGAGGILLLVSLMLGVVCDVRRYTTPVAPAALCVVAAMAVACLFNSALYDGVIGDFFCIALGLLIALGIRIEPALKPQKHQSGIPRP
jgi:O-antigen ligase